MHIGIFVPRRSTLQLMIFWPTLQRTLLLSLVILMTSIVTLGQRSAANYAPVDETSRAIKERILKAHGHFDDGDRLTAVRLFESILIDYPEIEDYPELSETAHFYLAFIWRGVHAFDLSLSHWYATQDALQRKKNADPKESYNVFGNIASIYVKRNQMDSALIIYKRALDWANAHGNKISISAANNNLGYFFERQGSLDSAQYYCTLAHAILGPDDDYDLRLSIEDNLASQAAKQGNYEKAREIYHNILDSKALTELARVRNSLTRFCKTQLRLGKVNLQLNKLEEAKANFQLARDSINTPRFKVAYGLKNEMLENWIGYYKAIGDYQRAFDLHIKLTAREDSASTKRELTLQNMLSSMAEFQVKQLKHESAILNEVQEQKVSNLEQKAQDRLLILFLTISLVLVGFGIGVALFIRRTRNQKRKAEIANLRNELLQAKLREEELEKQQALAAVSSKKKDISQLALSISRQRRWTEQLVEIGKTINAHPSEETGQQLKALLKEMDDDLVLDEKQQLLNEKVEDASNEFNDAIRKKYPQLVATEIELCALIRLKLTNKEISRIRNISLESARKARYRLKKKLGIGENQDLQQVLLEID